MSTPTLHLSAGFPAAAPKTPEPVVAGLAAPADTDVRPPSPPRPRLRLKRRAVPHLLAPTQNFLASVAAADVSHADIPIPSIEEPDATSSFPGLLHYQGQAEPLDQRLTPQLQLNTEDDGSFLSVRGRSRFSPPKTPAPGGAPLPQVQYPSWSIDSVFSSSAESSPDRDCDDSSRPSTARSTQTSSSSLFSRFTQLSDDEQCASPEDDCSDKFNLGPGGPLGELRRDFTFPSHDAAAAPVPVETRQRRKAPWTRAMSSHLWATYVLYLQDPKVTPFRVGKSCVPPHGVCLRVAREARRSWKGAKAMAKASSANTGTPGAEAPASAQATAPATSDQSSNKSGSSTPTAAGNSTQAGAFMEWPHTNAATRAHLRDLCRLKAATPGGGSRDLHFMSRSPTPFTQAAVHPRNPRVINSRSLSSSAFATQDMALSLTMSTSETMQPQGPLAQLTRWGSDVGQVPPLPVAPVPLQDTARAMAAAAPPTTAHDLAGRLTSAIEAEEPSSAERRRLGSPFTARSYGPSSSSSLAAILGLSASTSRHPHTVGPRRSLQSPVRLSRSTTQKRRSQPFGLDARKRPSLASDLFTKPSTSDTTGALAAASRPDRDMDFGFNSFAQGADPFVSAAEAAGPCTLPSSVSAPELVAPTTTNAPGPAARAADPLQRPQPSSQHVHTGSERQAPARLGSPFSTAMSSTSFSFPNRYSHSVDFDSSRLDRPFATVQRIAQPRPVRARTNLATRLAYIDQRLRELNHRNDKPRRRSESPL